jgi:hypothetical protein
VLQNGTQAGVHNGAGDVSTKKPEAPIKNHSSTAGIRLDYFTRIELDILKHEQ